MARDRLRAAGVLGLAVALLAACGEAQEGKKGAPPNALEVVRRGLAARPLEAFDEWRGLYVNGRPAGVSRESLKLERAGEREVAVHEVSLSLRQRGVTFAASGRTRFDARSLEPIEAERRVERRGGVKTYRLRREGTQVVYSAGDGAEEPKEARREAYDPKVLHVEGLVYVVARRLGREAAAPPLLAIPARTPSGDPLLVELSVTPKPQPVRVRGQEMPARLIVVGRGREPSEGSEMLYVDSAGRMLVQSTDAGASVPGGQSAVVSVVAADEATARGPLEPPIPPSRTFSTATPEGAIALFHDALLRGDLAAAEPAVDLLALHASLRERAKAGGEQPARGFPGFDAWRDDLLDEWLSLRGRADIVPSPEAPLERLPPAGGRAVVRAPWKPSGRIYTLAGSDGAWRIVAIAGEVR